MVKAIGGKNLYGYSIGILVLETKFPRIPGTWRMQRPGIFLFFIRSLEKRPLTRLCEKEPKGYWSVLSGGTGTGERGCESHHDQLRIPRIVSK